MCFDITLDIVQCLNVILCREYSIFLVKFSYSLISITCIQQSIVIVMITNVYKTFIL